MNWTKLGEAGLKVAPILIGAVMGVGGAVAYQNTKPVEANQAGCPPVKCEVKCPNPTACPSLRCPDLYFEGVKIKK